MKKRWLMMAAACLLLASSLALAQSGGSYDLTWSTVDGGGGTSTGGVYAVSGTAGQPDAGRLAGGIYAVEGGFVDGGEAPGQGHVTYLPVVMRNR